MDISLSIDRGRCIKCGRCVKVCPSGIFYRDDQSRDICLRNISCCIVCGHCAAVCPASAVLHGDFPPEKIHPVDRAALPSAESVMLLCRKRRSNRAFTDSPVPEEFLNSIVEAAHRAPTASNRQEVGFVVITDPAVLRQVTEYTLSGFAKAVKLMKNPLLKPFLRRIMPDAYLMLGRMENLQKEYGKGSDPILRKATALLLIHTPKENRFGRDDANLAYQNGSLMAESLGVAQFYTGFLCTAIRRDRRGRLASLLGIDGTIHAGMALGMPAFDYPNYIDRKEIEVKRI